MESPTFDSFDVAAVKIEATEECSNNANKTDFDNLCWIKKENQDQVDDVLVKSEQKYQYNDDLNNILENSTLIKTHGDDENNYNHEHQESVNQDLEHLNLNNQNNLMPFIKSEFNGAENNVHEQFNDHEIKLEEKIENNHDSSDLHHHDNHHHEDDGHEHEAETENRNNLVAFDDFGPETSVDEIVPEEKLNDDNEENEIENEELVPMETTISSSPSIEVTTNTLDELNFQEKAEEVIITPSSDLDDDSVDKQLSSVDNTNTISEVEEEVEPEDLLKSPVTEPAIDENIIMGQEEEILKSPDAEPIVDENIIVEEQNALIANSEHNLDLQIGNEEGGAAAHIDENTNIFSNEEQHVESTMNDSTNIVSAESVPQQQIHDSCEESDEEWNYMKTKEGQTEKENKNNASFTEDFKENIEPEPATEKEISSVELKEQLDLTPDLESPAAVDTATSIENTSAPAFDIEPLSPEPVSFESDKLQKTPENMMTDENNFHLNPEAKEFVPTTYTSPTSNNEQLNGGGDFGEINDLHRKQPYRHVFDDVVSQSPKKGRESNMDDLQLPAENDFDDEIANRPHELLDDDVQMPEESVKPIEEPTIEPQKENELLIQNALDNVGMKDSLYIENTSSGFNNGEVDLLNSIQPLPDIELEENNILSNKEGLSLEIDEKDVISPSSEDAKEIVTEIEEKLNDMLIQETSTVEDHVQQQQDVVMEEPHEPAKELEVVEPANEPEVTELYKEPEVMEQTKEPEVIEPTKEPEVAEPAKEQEVIELTKEPEVIEITKEPEVIETTKEPEVIESTKEPEVIEPVDQQNESVVVPEAESFVQQPEPFVAEVTPQVEEKLEESLVTNGDINVEELNKKNLEESAKLAEEQTAKIDDSKLLEATLGAVAVTAAVAATAKAASAKKSPASKTTTASSAKKPAVATTAARKLGTTTTSTAARPKTAPVKTIADRKPASTTKTTSVTSATKPRVEVKKTTTTTLSKPKEVTKTTEIKKTTSTRPMVPKAATTTAPKPRPASASVTNGISKTTTLKSTTTSSLKPTSTTAAPKPRLSPRSTVSSTLRKTETMKSPTAKSTSTTSRVDTGLKNVSAPKSASSATKPATTLRSKPATTTTSTTMKSTLKTTTTTTTSQRKTASPMDKKKLLAPTLTGPSSARKSLSKTPTKPSVAKKAETPAAKVETAAAPAPEIEEIKSEVEQASPAAVEMPIA